MAGILLSGPAGAGKSRIARRLWEENPGLAAILDFQSFYAAISGDTRGTDGRFPLRNERLLPLTEYIRRAALTGAINREVYTIMTNSDGSPARRRQLLSLMGDDAVEQVVDPGRAIIEARLSDPETAELSSDCSAAADRWYGNL